MPELHPAVVAEIAEAASWYEEERAGVGLRFLDAIDVALRKVDERPMTASALDGGQEFGIRRFGLGRFPYSLVFMTKPRCEVIAVAHQRREPGYWADRLKSAQ